jgi:hypothetical protein
VPISAQAGSTSSGGPAKSKHVVAVRYANHVRTTQHALPPGRDITSFSSSTRLDARRLSSAGLRSIKQPSKNARSPIKEVADVEEGRENAACLSKSRAGVERRIRGPD